MVVKDASRTACLASIRDCRVEVPEVEQRPHLLGIHTVGRGKAHPVDLTSDLIRRPGPSATLAIGNLTDRHPQDIAGTQSPHRPMERVF